MPNIQIFPDDAALASAAAGLFIEAAREAIATRGEFSAALAGGKTPEKTYGLIAAASDAVEWGKTALFFGDERFVPPGDERSNYGLARRSLLEQLPPPGPNVFPVATNAPTVADAARQYAGTLGEFFGLPANGAPPAFDLILLGLGDDGHTASLFPGKPSLAVTEQWVIASPPGTLPPPVDRVTFTFPLLNAARQVIFLIAGEKKAQAVRDILEGGAAANIHPAAGVRPVAGTLTWLLDEAAARLLTSDSSRRGL